MQTPTISGFQLAPQQKRLWQLQQNSSAFYAQCAVCIEGNLQPEILQNAIGKIINQHEILRTNFYRLPGVKTPVMVISDRNTPMWEYLDYGDKQDISTKIQELFSIARQENLNQDSLLRLFLIKLSTTEYILVISLPALCADTQSLKNLVNQISQAYSQCCQNQELSREYIQYTQFSEWQNQLLEDEDAKEAKEYWQQQKINSLAALKLPGEQRGKNSQFVTDNYQLVLSQELVEQISNLAQKYHTSIDIILLACWQILIWRITGESEIVIGTAASRREYEELNDTLGLLATYLPIKNQFTPNLCFSEVLKLVEKTLENAAEWQDYFVSETEDFVVFPIGFEFIPIFEKIFTEDASFALKEIFSYIEPFKVKLTCWQKNNCLILNFDYNVNYFSLENVHRLARQFQTLLTNAVAKSELAISQLEILHQEDYQKLVFDFNQTQVDYSPTKCIHELFAEQAIKNPDHIAVVYENQQITYRELNRKANQLAHYLQKQGVKPDIVVGLCLERSLEIIIGLLGILKAGGAYLPLDPNLPTDAISLRLKEGQVSLVITQQLLVNQFGEETVITIDSNWENIAGESDENPHTEVKPNNLVYVIFTSGSTGKPKGVATEHRQLLNYVEAISHQLHLPTSANYATVSSLSADLGNTMIFPALCRGGCLHIISSARVMNALELAEYCHQYPIDCLKIVPSHLSALLTATPSAVSILPRQCLILGGEAVSWKLISQIQKQAPNCQIFNHYGPTETTIGVLTYAVESQADDLISDPVPLGRPLANTQVYILDEELRPVPLGVAGELYIGGAGLSRGYLNQPELTAKSFISHSLLNQELRLYKTGDKVRYLENGNIEFLGRVDNQVKIRGYRLELAEIEITLAQHPEVQQAVVIAREEISGEKRLVAYIVTRNQYNLELDFRNFLKTKLPEYMIPTSFVILKTLPLTTNGKVDRNALPAPEKVVNRKNTFIPPRTPVEEVLAAIWKQLLNVSQVSINDNFFDLGGHSLLATQVISRIRTTFEVEIPLPQLFEFPTLATLGKQIETAIRGNKQEITTISLIPRDKNIPLSFAQQRLWFFDQFAPGSPTYNLPRAVRLQGKLKINALAASLNEIIKRHEILRTSFVIVDGQPVQVISNTVNLDLPIVDLQNIPQKQRETELYRLAKKEAQTGFDLAQSPLLRGKLLQLDAEEYVILLTLHHIVSDGWSTDILIREIAALYTAFCTAKPYPLPQLPIQYADFAIWQRRWLEGEALKNQLAYWQKKLSGELTILQLPTDRPRPKVQTYTGKTLSYVLPKSLTEALKTLSQQEGVTLFMTLLAGFKTLLYRYTGQTDILVGSPIANRNRAEIENLIGFFVNTLVLRSQFSPNSTFRDLLKQVREVALGAYAHQDLPFEKLVEEIQPERNLSHNSLFQVMFVFQNGVNKQLDLPGLKVEPLEVNNTTAKFDLTLVLEEVEQGLIANFEYNTDLFDEITISRLAANFEVLLTGIVDEPQQQIWQLPLMTTTEEQQLLKWSQGETNIVPELCLHQLFEAQVERTPDAVAVVFENEQLTYRKLNLRANQLAHYLQELGVGPEVLVGICVERSPLMVIGILAILKAGGAYVPLDPAYPQERLVGMIEDAQVSVLLTQEKLQENLPFHHSQIVCLDIDRETISQESNPINKATPENLAYVIYTSGSTGKPKGVQISHRAVVNFLMAMRQTPGLTAQDILLSVTTLSFDIAALEIYLPLIVGAQVVIVSRQQASDGMQLSKLLSSSGATVMQATPATWRMLLSAGWNGEQKLKILCGGEALDYTLAQQLQQRGREVWNLYGPTETTIWSAAWKVQNKEAIAKGGALPIASPIANTQFYILDPYNQLVPIGVAGELHIGGAGLARGYLHQSELTAQKFICNPFNSDSTSRLYKTGDLVRYQPDGTIEFLGRIDHQVKLRGFRIELGEIESALNQHPNIQASVVIVRENQPGDRHLVAYLVSKSPQVIDTTQIRSFLQQKLPSYMLPTALIILDELPLTPNGKINRQALPAPNTSTKRKENFVSPHTPTEQIIADIWADVLGRKQIGIYDNFFDLGGHSLLATQVSSRVRETFRIDLPVRILFENPTVKNLVEQIEGILTVQQLQTVQEQMVEDREEIEL